MKKRLLYTVLFIAYCAMLVNVLVFKNLPVIQIGKMHFRFGGTHTGAPNLVPFRSIGPYLLGRRGSLIGFVNIAGNIILPVPVGFLAPLIFRGLSWKRVLILALASGLFLEVLQEIFQVGIFDVDDVILNALGVLVGYWLFNRFSRRKPVAR